MTVSEFEVVEVVNAVWQSMLGMECYDMGPEAALDDQEAALPPLAEGATLGCRQVEPLPHETKPPARFTEATLIRKLEEEGVGRPSTYATIIGTIQDRGYVRKTGSQLVPTFTAMAVTVRLPPPAESSCRVRPWPAMLAVT